MPNLPLKEMPYYHCPRFGRCAVNHCPLDPEHALHLTDPGDPEKKCKALKNTRLAVVERLRAAGNKYVDKLEFGGLTGREHSGKLLAERFAAMSPEEQQRRLKPLQSHQFVRGLSTDAPVSSRDEQKPGERGATPLPDGEE